MDTLGASPFAWLEFDETGALVDANAGAALAGLLADPAVGDLVVLSHGWKNSRADATTLYSTLWGNVCAALAHRQPQHVAVCGVLWPAKAYSTDFDTAALMQASEGGTLAVSGGVAPRDLSDVEFQAALDGFRDVFGHAADGTLAQAKDAAAKGFNDSRSRGLYTSATTTAGCDAAAADRELAADAKPFARPDNAQSILSGLVAPPTMHTRPGMGATLGLGDIARDVFYGTRAAVARFLNNLTYYEMKKRAGIVGAALGTTMLPRLHPDHAVRLHLVGHSFGARLVTAAASSLPAPLGLMQFYSLTLLQGAFSQNALAATVTPGVPGAFANVVGRASGPISMTHTHNDMACTLAYALASRLSRDVATAIGDASDLYGAMGANGAQKLAPDVLAPDNTAEPFAPVAGKVNGFLADAYVVKTAATDAHNNITNPTVGRLVASVID